MNKLSSTTVLIEAAIEQALGADSRGAGFYGEMSARAAQAQRWAEQVQVFSV